MQAIIPAHRQVIPWGTNLAEWKELRRFKPLTIVAGMATIAKAMFDPRIVNAATTSGPIAAKIIKAFDPLLELVQGISYPVCFLTISAGFLLIVMGQKEKGLNLLKWAVIGYIGLQFAPAIMQMLMVIGQAMKAVG